MSRSTQLSAIPQRTTHSVGCLVPCLLTAADRLCERDLLYTTMIEMLDRPETSLLLFLSSLYTCLLGQVKQQSTIPYT